MSQETVTYAQKVTGWLFVGSGPLVWVAQNATAITALTTVITGAIFAGCAIANTLTKRKEARLTDKANEINEQAMKINERDIKIAMIKQLEKDGKCDEAQIIRDTMVKGLQE